MRYIGPIVATVVTAVALLLALAVFAGMQGAGQKASHSISGELVSFEAAHGTLVLRTGSGEQHFVVRAGTPVHDGTRSVALAELAGADGCPAKIRYREQDGAWMASDVRLSCRQVGGHAPAIEP